MRTHKNYHEELIIDGEIIKNDTLTTLKLNAGKLPSGNIINVIAHIYKSSNPGPSLLILGGIHGDEINGIETVRRLAVSNQISNIKKGCLIVIPLLNVHGFINFSREVSDGKDVNRSFPGHMNGSLASRIARILSKKILPYIDLAIDFHTGGAARYNIPQIRYYAKDAKARQLAEYTGVKFQIQQGLIANSFRKVAHDMNVAAIVFEGGESIRFDSLSITEGLRSINNVLVALEMLDGTIQKSKDIITLQKTSWIRSEMAGIFLWSKKSGDYIRQGDHVGDIMDPYGTKSISVVSKFEGYIIGHNNASVIALGDPLFHVGITQ